jgi:hypothetical protein
VVYICNIDDHYRLLMTASVNYEQVALPPRSPVL